MTDMEMASQMATFATQTVKTTGSVAKLFESMVKYFMELLKDNEVRGQILSFCQKGLDLEGKLPPGEKLGFESYTIEPSFAKQLYDICKREDIGYLASGSNVFDLVTDGKGDSIQSLRDSIWIYTPQKNQFLQAVMEAKVRSGYDQEIDLDRLTAKVDGVSIASKMAKDGNQIQVIHEIPYEKYLAIRQDIKRLSPEMQFTIFPRFYEKDGQKMVDIGHLSYTEKKYNRKGNVYKEPKQYDISKMMKDILLREAIVDRSANADLYKESLMTKDEMKRDTIEDLLRNKNITVDTIKESIDGLNTTEPVKMQVKDTIAKFERNELSKEDLKKEIDKVRELDSSVKDHIKKDIDELGQESYVIPMRITMKNGEPEFNAILKDSICVGKRITVRSAGKEDLVIGDESSMRANLDKVLTGYAERENGGKNDFGFVVLTANEYRQIENGNPAFVGPNHLLRNDKIDYLKRNKEKIKKTVLNRPEEQKTKEEKYAEQLIDIMNKKREELLLRSDIKGTPVQDMVDALERVEAHPEGTVETFTNEVDSAQTTQEVKDDAEVTSILYEAEEEVARIESEPYIDGFDDYIMSQIGGEEPDMGHEGHALENLEL